MGLGGKLPLTQGTFWSSKMKSPGARAIAINCHINLKHLPKNRGPDREIWSKLQIFHVYKFDYNVRVILGCFSSTKRIFLGWLASACHYTTTIQIK